MKNLLAAILILAIAHHAPVEAAALNSSIEQQFLPSRQFLKNPGAENGATGWNIYNDTQTFATSDVNTGTDVVTVTAHGMTDGYPVAFSSSTTVPAGLTAGTTYFIRDVTTNTFKVAATLGGTAIDITSTGTGTHTVRPLKPINGTGGTSTLTFGTTPSTPLAGARSFLETKAASNVAGEGWSTDFSIDNKDQGRQIQVSLDYEIPSGTYVGTPTCAVSPGSATAGADLTAWIYDVTNSQLIEVTPYCILGGSGKIPFKANFQSASNSTSYRLSIHHSSTSASAFTFKHEAGVSAVVRAYGTPVTDWRAYTPTSTWVTNATHTGFYQQVGDSMEFQVQILLTGAPTSATLQINQPSFCTIDTAKLAGASGNADNTVGTTSVLDTGTKLYTPGGVLVVSSTVVEPRTDDGVSGTATITQAAPMTFAVGDRVWLRYKVPCVGRSSSAEQSSETDSRVVAAGLIYSSASLSGSYSDISWTTTGGFDTHGGLTSATTYTVQVPGFYRLSIVGALTGSTITVGQAVGLQILKNGSAIKTVTNNVTANAVNPPGITVVHTAQLAAGDTIKFQAINGTGTPTWNSNPHASIERLSGPAQISPSETVAARYGHSAAQSFTSGATAIVDFANKMSHDTHAAVTTGASWKFTAPSAGKYSVAATVIFDTGSWAAGDIGRMQLYKNGAAYSIIGYHRQLATFASMIVPLSGSDEIDLLAGDYIDVRVDQNTGGARVLWNANTHNHIAIRRVGN